MGYRSVTSPSNLTAVTGAENASDNLAEQVSSAFAELARSSSMSVAAGDVSARVPNSNTMIITPHTSFVQSIDEGECLQVASDGRVAHRRGRGSVLERIHLEIYRRCTDVQAIVHNHAPLATVLGICDLPIPPVTFDSIPFVDLPRVAVVSVPVEQWPGNIAGALANGAPAALLVNDGAITVGRDLRQAVGRALALEELARILVLSRLLQMVPSSLPPDAVEALKLVCW